MKLYLSALVCFVIITVGYSEAAAPVKKESPAQIAAKKNFEAVKSAAAKGDAVKLRDLAELYYTGKGVGRNYTEAYKAYLSSAEKGDVLSEATVAWMLRNGQGASKDYKKSLEWYTKAAEKGHVESQLGLAEIYYNKVGLEQRDYSMAYKWYLIASGLGSKDAKAFIPRMVQSVLKDPHVKPEQKTAAEKAAESWLAAYSNK